METPALHGALGPQAVLLECVGAGPRAAESCLLPPLGAVAVYGEGTLVYCLCKKPVKIKGNNLFNRCMFLAIRDSQATKKLTD